MRYTLEKEVLKLACESFPKTSIYDLKKNMVLQEELIGQKGKETDFHTCLTRNSIRLFLKETKRKIFGKRLQELVPIIIG